jgi:hypothetical protein
MEAGRKKIEVSQLSQQRGSSIDSIGYENHLNRGGHQWQTKKQTWQGRGSATMTN